MPALPTRLRILDGLDQLAMADQEPEDLKAAVRALAQERGQVLTAAQVEAVAAHADPRHPAPPPSGMWTRPANRAEWAAFMEAETQSQSWARRRKWAVVLGSAIGAPLGTLAAIAAGMMVGFGTSGLVAITTATLTVLLIGLLGFTDELDWWADWPGLRRLKENARKREGQPARWESVPPHPWNFQEWVKVPGLAACLATVLDSDVPWLWEDQHQCQLRLKAWESAREKAEEANQHAKQKTALWEIVKPALPKEAI